LTALAYPPDPVYPVAMSTLPGSGVYAITDCENFPDGTVLGKTRVMLEQGIAVLQYRNKNRASPEYLPLAQQLLSLCRQYDCPLIINDDLELTRSIDADGLHLGQNDLAIGTARSGLGHGKLIGCSCHDRLETAIEAERQGADYIALGAFYRSPTKPDAGRIELSRLQTIRRAVSGPIVAIGGITPANGRAVVKAGADMLAAVSGLYGAADTARAVRQYQACFR